MFLLSIPKLPVASWIEKFTDWLVNVGAGFFNAIQHGGQSLMDEVSKYLLWLNPIVVIVFLTVLAFYISNRKWGFAAFSLLGLLFVYNQGLWSSMMDTFTLVLLSGVISVVIGVPLGIWSAKSNRAQAIIKPILDFMQTMPAFVYLIPAVAFFGIGVVPGVFASVIFALPPTVRMTDLGIRSVPKELQEASESFGATGWQKLFKMDLPLAKNTIMAGINQTLMLSLSMVVTASMIGASGLGQGVLSALQRAQVGNGFVNGLALVVLAIIIDRMVQYANDRMSETKLIPQADRKRREIINWTILGLIVASIAGFGVSQAVSATSQSQEKVVLAYPQWDTEVASTNVVAEVLKDQGFDVEIVSLDNAIMWQSVANGESDAMVSAWLPTTHAEQYKKFKNKLDNLGPNLTGVKTGLVVPSYMSVNSISDLTTQANQTITGIEPGAGVVDAAEKTLKAYPNLKDWKITTSSTGAMTASLAKAIKNHEDIVITGWAPHWMFQKYDLKFLEDPKKTMGANESINTIVNLNFKSKNPKAYKILDNFKWDQKDIESVMSDIHDGMSPEKAAQKWINNNHDKVKSWVK